MTVHPLETFILKDINLKKAHAQTYINSFIISNPKMSILDIIISSQACYKLGWH